MSLLYPRIPLKTSYLTSLLTPDPSFEPEVNTSQKSAGKKMAPAPNEHDRSIYQNVLAFPQGAEHLKYFEKNPHPDRFPPELLNSIAQFAKDDLNISTLQRQMEFNLVKKYLKPKLSDIDERILGLPDAVRGLLEKEQDKNYRIAYEHLLNCFLNYFSTPTDPSILPDIQWLPYYFIYGYKPAQKALKDLQANLFNEKARATLEKKLREAGAFGDKRIDFYLWNTDPHNWSKMSFQARSVIFPTDSPSKLIRLGKTVQFGVESILKLNFNLPPQYYALGNFTINALPEGYVEPLGNGKYRVCIVKIYFFINDIFNFEGDAYLGRWELSTENERLTQAVPNPLFPVHNSYFTDFQRHGYGRNFPVLSTLHEMEDFHPQCLEYFLEK